MTRYAAEYAAAFFTAFFFFFPMMITTLIHYFPFVYVIGHYAT